MASGEMKPKAMKTTFRVFALLILTVSVFASYLKSQRFETYRPRNAKRGCFPRAICFWKSLEVVKGNPSAA